MTLSLTEQAALASFKTAAYLDGAVPTVVPTPPKAGSILTSYGAAAHNPLFWANTCANGITIGVTSVTHSLANERPRFETYTRKCVLGADPAEIRFASANIVPDVDDCALSVDIYIEQAIGEYAGTNPFITIQISNEINLTNAHYSRWVFNAQFLRQGWNTLKIRRSDTVSSTAGAGNLPTGVSHPADVGNGFRWAKDAAYPQPGNGTSGIAQFISLTFNTMNGFTVHIDQIRKPARAKTVFILGFDSSGAGSADEVFPNKVSPLLARWGMKSYCTMTNIYELLFSGGQAWKRMINLYNNHSWDIVNHTWSHGATEVGRVLTLTSLTRTGGNLVTGVVAGGHPFTVNKTFKVNIKGATGASGTTMNGNFDITITSTTNFTYTSVGTDGAATGTLLLYTFLSEVFDANDAERVRLLTHEIGDIKRVLEGNGFTRAKTFALMPNNSQAELSLRQTVCNSLGVNYIRGYRGGFTFINEFGPDNPLDMGSMVLDSGPSYTKLSDIKAKCLSAIERGEHLHLFGHFILDDEDPANAAYKPVDPDYPPAQGGNPNPPAGISLSGYGGWWYYSQLRKLMEDVIGPAIVSGQALGMSLAEYEAYLSGVEL